jgi:hypothetical protein
MGLRGNNKKQIKFTSCCKRDKFIRLARLHLLQQKAERQQANIVIEATSIN